MLAHVQLLPTSGTTHASKYGSMEISKWTSNSRRCWPWNRCLGLYTGICSRWCDDDSAHLYIVGDVQDWVILLSCLRLALLFFHAVASSCLSSPFLYFCFLMTCYNILSCEVYLLSLFGMWAKRPVKLHFFENITVAALQRAYLLPPQTRLNSTEVNLILRLLSPWRSAANSERRSPYRTPSFRHIAFVPALRFCVDCPLTCANKTAKPWQCVCSFAW